MRPYAYPSKLAILSRRIGLSGLLIAAFGVYFARSGKLLPIQALSIVGLALFLAAAALTCASGSLIVIWRTGAEGLKSACVGLLTAFILLSYPVYLALLSFSLPLLTDVTTDFNDPPQIVVESIALPYQPAFAKLQRERYQSVQPVILDLDLEESQALVLEAVKLMGLTPSNGVSPLNSAKQTQITLIDTTAVLKLPEDMTIRLKRIGLSEKNPETRLDMRSSSRFGRHDFGSNAARLSSLIEQIAEVLKKKTAIM